ncbi:MAG: CHAT domain-containing protein [Aphanocapsa lilacina HA4352-LM1]|jgi:CHAT domain-containing protein/Tfp pilus assembly protein PilF|nr:CHAT domain-containing protein [Aphanocapsa lilacina HA4352-LM1]
MAASEYQPPRRLARGLAALAAALLLVSCPGALFAQAQPAAEADRLSAQIRSLQAAGRFAEAIVLGRRRLELLEQTLGAEHPQVADSLNNLAVLHGVQGDYAEAEALFERTLALRERAFGPTHPLVAKGLYGLAMLYGARGNLTEAQPLAERALAIRRQTLGADHPQVAKSLHGLAMLLMARGAGDTAAEGYFLEALAVWKKTLGAEHPEAARSLHGLAMLCRLRGEVERAEALFLRVRAIWEKAYGPDHPDVARSLHSLAGLYLDQGRLDEAEPLFRRAFAVREASLGANHPGLAQSLQGLAQLAVRQGEPERARTLIARALEIQEHNLADSLAAGSERHKRDYLQVLTAATDTAISLHLRSSPADPAAARLAFATVLRRKGRILDVQSGSLAALRAHLAPADQVLLDQWTAARTRLATLAFGVLGEDAPVSAATGGSQSLQREAERFEAALSRRSAEFVALSAPADPQSVQRQIPGATVLVELMLYRPLNLQATRFSEQFAAPRYAAYLFDGRGALDWVDLGEAQAIDATVQVFRNAVRNSALPTAELKAAARRLDRVLMEPVRAKLGGRRRLLVSPDGALNLIPFAALVDEQGRFLVERFTIQYLGSGRDLLRLARPAGLRRPPLLMADPDFDRAGAVVDRLAAAGNIETRAGKFDALGFAALPATAKEVAALAELLPDAQVLTQAAATESALKRSSGPSILHIATHGFFLRPTAQAQNPLLRSGLALAGVNVRKSGGDDGVLTALEMAGLDLRGTRLAVLSACETGLGDVESGEGVYGLRRALTLAGAASQLVSLWRVEDATIRDLMVGFYGELRAGAGSGDALRRVQLTMLRSRHYRHPYYWSAFIPSGDWRPLAELFARPGRRP